MQTKNISHPVEIKYFAIQIWKYFNGMLFMKRKLLFGISNLSTFGESYLTVSSDELKKCSQATRAF